MYVCVYIYICIYCMYVCIYIYIHTYLYILIWAVLLDGPGHAAGGLRPGAGGAGRPGGLA